MTRKGQLVFLNKFWKTSGFYGDVSKCEDIIVKGSPYNLVKNCVPFLLHMAF